MYNLPPAEKTHLEPEGGWKEHTYYVVDVACNKHNPIHRRILFIGFLNDAGGCPFKGGYTSLLCISSDDGIAVCDLHYIKPVSVIADMS